MEQMKMTKQEIKEESKQSEGDPQVKSRIKTLQYQAARKRMMQEVPESDVVVTNPTHLAVAIQYDALKMNAPKIVAKGAGRIAERIKAIAYEHSVPVVENKELAQNLYKLIDIGEEVPAQFFQAVAELLAYVYKLKGKPS
jgi:flagellar biosynthetic protein FlhB